MSKSKEVYHERQGHKLYYVGFFRWLFTGGKVVGCTECKGAWKWTADVESPCSKEKTK